MTKTPGIVVLEVRELVRADGVRFIRIEPLEQRSAEDDRRSAEGRQRERVRDASALQIDELEVRRREATCGDEPIEARADCFVGNRPGTDQPPNHFRLTLRQKEQARACHERDDPGTIAGPERQRRHGAHEQPEGPEGNEEPDHE